MLQGNYIPITQEVIDRVETLAKKYGINYALKFKDREQGIILKYEDEDDYNDATIAGV